MEDENLAQFQAVTGADLAKAQQYLQLSDNNLERAVELFFSTGGVDLLSEAPAPAPAPVSETRPSHSGENEVINLDSDEEEDTTRPAAGHSVEDDEAMARRLQEEMYGAGGAGNAGGAAGAADVDADGYRAPIARTRETLVGGPGADDYDLDDPQDRATAVLQQVRRREQARLARSRRPNIFNQQPGASIWNESAAEQERRHTTTAGTSSTPSSKATQLAEMYRPPFDLMSPLDWDMARDEGKSGLKWLLVNIQDTSIFDCQVLNRDLWKDEGIRETVKEHFIFLQFNKDDPAGDRYMNYYFRDRDIQSSYPHIAIVDPRTGEQVKKWSGPPPPKPMEFLMQLHEFLDRYSLDVTAKNPVARRKPQERRESKIERMTEDEQLEWALKHSVEGDTAGGLSAENDPDALTRSIGDMKKEQAGNGDVEMTSAENEEVDEATSAFKAISAVEPHSEPDASVESTRIQFRHREGRVVRRFAVADPVRRIYEWLKADPLGEHKLGDVFELISLGKNLIGNLDSTIGEAGLKQGTVMVEYVE